MKVEKVKQGLRMVSKSNLDLFKSGNTSQCLDAEIKQFLTQSDVTGDKAKENDLTAKVNTFVYITLTRMFDACFAPVKDDDLDSYSKEHSNEALLPKVSTKIGEDIEMFYRMSILRGQDKSLFNQVYYGNLSDQALGQDWHVKCAKGQLDSVDSGWKAWGPEKVARIGRIFIAFVQEYFAQSEEEGPFIQVIKVLDGKSHTFIAATESLLEEVALDFKSINDHLIKDEFMVCPPQDWADGVQGGYLTNNEVQRDDIIRGHYFLGRSTPGDKAYAFINTLQGVQYKINTDVLAVATALEAAQVKVGKFYPAKSITAQVNKDGSTRKNSAFTRRATVRTESALEMARKYSDYDRLWSPWSFDFRGRVYPMVSSCSPQGTDLDKSLITLADGEELTEVGRWWLYIHIATTFGKGGVDKLPLADRVEWTHNNHDLLVAVGTDPVGNLDMWSGAEEPWMFLAGCLEYVKVVINGGLTTLMVATDATCSGLQVLSGLGLDRKTGSLVNVVPGDTRQDAYMVVAAKAVDLLNKKAEESEDADDAAEFLEAAGYLQDTSKARKIAKKVVMTVPYNASTRTNYGQVTKALKELGFTVSKSMSKIIGTSIVEAMYEVVPGAMELRDWLNDRVKDYFGKPGSERFLSWTTPSGFTVHQEKFIWELLTINSYLVGGKRSQMDIAVGPKTDEFGYTETRVKAHKSSFMPNLIHSLDASLLALSFHSVDYSVSVIHDSILTGANHMGTAVQALKESYEFMFKDRTFLDTDLRKVLRTEVAAPTFDDSFESSDVLKSDFFFS